MIWCVLRSILEERQITQKDLAAGVNAHEWTISRLCNNNVKKYDIALLNDICRYLGIELNELVRYRLD